MHPNESVSARIHKQLNIVTYIGLNRAKEQKYTFIKKIIEKKTKNYTKEKPQMFFIFTISIQPVYCSHPIPHFHSIHFPIHSKYLYSLSKYLYTANSHHSFFDQIFVNHQYESPGFCFLFFVNNKNSKCQSKHMAMFIDVCSRNLVHL
eukprot:510401_1